MEIAKENMGLWSILCFLYQSIHYVLRYMLRAKVYKKLHSRNPNQPHSIEAEAFSSTSASFMPFACRVGSCHALSWRTKLSHCRGLQTSGWLQCTIKRQCAGPCRLVHRVTFHAQKAKESERVGKLDSLSPGKLTASRFLSFGECMCIHSDLIANGKPVCQRDDSMSVYCKHVSFRHQPNPRKKKPTTLWAWEGDKLFHKGIRMFLCCECDLHISVIFETSVS